MANLTDIRRAVEATIKGIDQLKVYATVPESANPPCVVIEPNNPGIDYRLAYRTSVAEWRLALIVITGRVDSEGQQELLDEYISPTGAKSIPLAIFNSPTLGGVVDSAICQQLTRYGRFRFGNLEYIGAQIEMEVIA